MKVKPTDYARAILEVAESTGNLSQIAAKFWHSLQKNGQYRDLSRVLNLLEDEYAKKHNIIIAKVISATPLPKEEIGLIRDRLTKRFEKEVVIKEIIKENLLTGAIVKVGDLEIDASSLGKIERLRKRLIG